MVLLSTNAKVSKATDNKDSNTLKPVNHDEPGNH